MQIREKISLKDYSNLEVGGDADFFVEVNGEEELHEALAFAKSKKIPYFILGGGSNTLFSDEGFRGLVIKNSFHKLEFQENFLRVGSGVVLAAIVMESARRGLAGLEEFAGIPGSVGGSIVGNANKIGELVKSVKVLVEGGSAKLTKDDLEFRYRDSNLRGKVLLEVEFELTPSSENLQLKVGEIAREKMKKHPSQKTLGSWFRNPSSAKASEGKSSQMKAWKLILDSGCGGLRSGDAMVSEIHANFFQNAGNATSHDFLELEKKVKAKVKEKFDVELEREVIVVS